MFSQIVIKYSADSAVKAGITYECNGEIIHDGIYLDAAENGIFSMLIQGALEGKTAKNDQVEVDSSVKIQEVTTGMVELSEEAWIEKDGLRLGISFMDNGVILVKNRFTDYSGLSHSIRSQELPAFYVVSALDIFTWEDEGVQNSRDDMIFWPDASDQNFILKKPDQAFCIWHDESGYGVGLAVPGES